MDQDQNKANDSRYVDRDTLVNGLQNSSIAKSLATVWRSVEILSLQRQNHLNGCKVEYCKHQIEEVVPKVNL